VCLLVLAWNAHPRYRLIVAANRDEYHDRPSAPLARWAEPSQVVGGQDLRAGGAWLAVGGRQRFGVVTNFREMRRPRTESPSRGDLIPSYLSHEAGTHDFLCALEAEAQNFSGFNLLLADERDLWYATNRAEPFVRRLQPGIHGLSNQFLDTPWPKLLRVRRRFATWLAEYPDLPREELFDMLADRTQVTADEDLPRTGLPIERERLISSPFVLDPSYGTRCSTIVMMETSGATLIAERRFDSTGMMTGETELALNA
jgi:uncharacterized protein with NRDE domain